MWPGDVIGDFMSVWNITCTAIHRLLCACKILFVWHQSFIVKPSGQTSWQTDRNTHTQNTQGENIITSLTLVIIIREYFKWTNAGHLREIFDALICANKRHYSCQTVLLKFVEDVKSALDGGHKVETIFMDLSQGFDCLPHGLLIAQLHAYCYSMSAWAQISNSLSNRQQCVKVLDNCSTSGELYKVRCWVLHYSMFFYEWYVFIREKLQLLQLCKW